MNTNVKHEDAFLINNELLFLPSERRISSIVNEETEQLTNQVSKLLCYLCMNSRMLIKYNDIMQFVWGERYRFISYGSVYQALLSLRKALKNIAISPVEIKSIRKEGIIFNATVKKQQQEPLIQDTSIIAERNAMTEPLYSSQMFYFTVAIITMITITTLSVLYNRGRGAFDNYTVKDNTGGECNIRLNSDAVDSRRHINFLEKHQYLCTPDTTLYITAYENNHTLSVIQCRNNYLVKSKMGNCRSLLYISEL